MIKTIKQKIKIKFYKQFGVSSGFLINSKDILFRPLSKCRGERCWVDSSGEISTYYWEQGEDAINIPEKDFWSMLEMEKNKELGVDLIDRYLKKMY